jgi:hypothetical protein
MVGDAQVLLLRIVPVEGRDGEMIIRVFDPILSWGPTVSIAFWSKFSPVDFNRDFAACLIYLPCTTSPAIFNCYNDDFRPWT